MNQDKGLNIQASLNLFNDVLSTIKCANLDGALQDTDESFDDVVQKLLDVRSSKSHVYVVGNGGSASIASHMAIDLLNMSKIKAHTLFDHSTLTCISNDYGYKNVFSKPLDTLLDEGDILFAISSSGRSSNIINAVNVAQMKGAYVITLSGFLSDNPLRKLGTQNIWLDSCDYGVVEIGHAFVLHNIADRLAVRTK
ncbi:Phosphoheptose isomerase [hydrothermal vent metagenome]|uniref:Phosphoheptose isomerase n=1 Tax=hydrothermal vent metagenome TaxID=652676 RepID=A0A3B1BEQ4_9ZZZZ